MDKSAILGDATRMLIQLRDEAEKLKESYERLQEKVNELKVCQIFVIHSCNSNSCMEASFYLGVPIVHLHCEDTSLPIDPQ